MTCMVRSIGLNKGRGKREIKENRLQEDRVMEREVEGREDRKMVKYHDVTDKEEIRGEGRENDGKEDGTCTKV
jgi:hypothetical protein